jgi:ditrans,polycis-polyprenyl diphosphate synthase
MKCGPIPRHVAFIIDGNRRYAKKLNLETIERHKQGFDTMTLLLEWCLHLRIKEVTIYALSINNFGRPKEEVNKFLDFMKEMFAEMIENIQDFNDSGTRIRVFGNLSLLSVEMQKLLAEIVLLTQQNSKIYLNICFAYASRHEITNAIKELSYCVKNNIIKTNDINESLSSKFLFTSYSSEPDLVIRTSVEV